MPGVPFNSFDDIKPGDVDGTIKRIKELDQLNLLPKNSVNEGLFEYLANRIVDAGGDVNDFDVKLEALRLNVKFDD